MNRESKLQSLIACGALAIAASGQAPAQTAKPAESMGRLFFTPAQRAQLDVARSQKARSALAAEKAEETQATPTPQTITYEGAVRSSDGKTTVFINRRPLTEKESQSGAVVIGRVRPDGSISLQIPQSGRAVELKPGQSIELLSGTIEERYSRNPVAPESKPATKPATESKPTASASENSTNERDKDEQQRKVDEAIRAIQDAAAKSSTAPTPQSPIPPR